MIKLTRARSRRYRRYEYFGSGYDYGYIEVSNGKYYIYGTTEYVYQLLTLILKEGRFYEAIQK